MDSDESNSNDDNHHPSKPSSPKRRKIESANLPMQNEERTPITVSDLANRVNAPPQDLQVDLGMRSLVGYVHGQQLQRLQMEQQQRLKSQLNILTSDVPMHSKWSTQEISNALVSKDINVPRPADHYVPSQAELEYLALRQKELPFGISTTPSSQLLSQHPLVVEEEDSKGSMSTTSPSTAARKSDIDFWILDGREILISFGKFPYYLCDRTKHSLVASFFLHTKHHEYARCNSEPHHAGRSGILLSGPTGSAIYQEKLAMALAHHFSAKFLVLCKDFYPAIKTSDCSRADLPHAIETYEPWIDYPPDLIFDKRMSETIPWSMTLRRIIYPLTIGPDCSTMGVGPSHDAVWIHFRKRPIQSLANPQPETNYQSFNRGDRVVFVGLNFGGLYATDSPRGPTFGSLGEIVYTAQSSYLSKLSVRFDKPIREGLDLGGICKAGYGFYCNANELCLDPKTLEDFDKSIINDYLEAITCASRDSPFILFMEDVGKFLLDNPEAYLVIKYLINKLPENVVVLGSHTPRENNKGKESYFRKRWKHKKLPETAKLLSELFPNKISIEMPEVGKQIAVLKHQFSEDAKVITAEENLACLNHVLIQSGLDCDELEKLSVMDPVLIQSCLDCDEFEKLSVMDQRITYESAEKVVRWAIGHQLMEYPQSTANSPVLSIKSIEYGISVLRETQTEKKSSKKSLKDVVTANVFETNLLSEVILPEETGVTFDDVGALENVKDTLRELVMLPLQRPELFSKGQLRKPCKGILLFGPPGTGKTMLAKAIATEAGANFINISMSTIAAKWYGDAEKYVRAVFSLAIKIAPSIIFVDEVDSLLGRRGSQEYEVSRRIKNEFMVNWDGLRTKDGERVMVLAATNRPFDIDEAVIRRMPRRFMVNLPNASNRSKILRVILEKEELAPDVDFHAISSMTDGYSGSDLKNLCVTAAYCPIRDILQTEKQKNAAKVSDEDPMPELKMTSEIRPISMEDFKYAREQIRASSSTESTSLIELLEWNEQYGEGGSRGETTLSYFM